MINATNPVFGQAPEAFNGVGVCVTRDIDLRRMMDALVLVAEPLQWIVGDPFIGKDRAFRHGALDNVRYKRIAASVRDNFGHDAALTLYHAEDGSFADSARTLVELLVFMFVLFETAKMAFIRFDFAGQLRTVIFVQHRADLLEHTPRALVGDANLPLKLLCADSALSRSHQENGMKPEFERRSRILKDCAAHWVLMMTTELTNIRRALGSAMMLRDLLALRAKDTVWIEPILKPFETSRVVWELTVKFHLRERAFGYT